VSQLATLLLMINSTHLTQTTTKMDDLWSEIQDMPGEIFDFTELEENDSEMNVKCDEFNQKDYTV
tara:strand:- start:4514 stop:4708 length:195 start_codon:yes stop_codon:yes gene_type:complete